MTDNHPSERRRETRLECHYPLLIRCKNPSSPAISAHTVSDNVCSKGLYFQFPQALPQGQPIFTLLQLPQGAKLAARGRILRQEAQPHGMSGIAVHFSQTRIIP